MSNYRADKSSFLCEDDRQTASNWLSVDRDLVIHIKRWQLQDSTIIASIQMHLRYVKLEICRQNAEDRASII